MDITTVLVGIFALVIADTLSNMKECVDFNSNYTLIRNIENMIIYSICRLKAYFIENYVIEVDRL